MNKHLDIAPEVAQALRDGDCYLTAELTDELPPRTEEELAACAEAWRR